MLTAALQGASQFYLTKDSTWAQYALQEAEIKRVEAQTLLLDEELLKAKISTGIADTTKDEQIRMVEIGLLQQEDALAVSKERHGMNFKPAFSQE